MPHPRYDYEARPREPKAKYRGLSLFVYASLSDGIRTATYMSFLMLYPYTLSALSS